MRAGCVTGKNVGGALRRKADEVGLQGKLDLHVHDATMAMRALHRTVKEELGESVRSIEKRTRKVEATCKIKASKEEVGEVRRANEYIESQVSDLSNELKSTLQSLQKRLFDVERKRLTKSYGYKAVRAVL